MLTEQQLTRATELFTAAVNYNAALHAAFVSTDDMVEVDLVHNGITERVSIPTYHYLLGMINKLSRQVAQMQVSDDGSDVVQLLTTADNLALLYLQKRQFYVQPPTGAKLVKYDYETMPTAYSAANRTALFIDMSECKLPADAQIVLAAFDDLAPMQLHLQFKTTSMDKVANVLSISGENEATMYLIDSNDLQVGDQVQCNSTVYNVTYVSGQTIQLSCDQPVALQSIMPGDVLYSITGNAVAYLEVPVDALHKTLSLQVQYMQLLSAKAIYDVSGMSEAIHTTERVPVADMFTGITNANVLSLAGTAMRGIPDNLSEILANSVPKITKTTIKQTNTHQYVHSTIETMVKTNAILVQAKQDIQSLEVLINELTATIVQAGGDPTANESLLSYNDQLASAKNRYQSAQASLASMNVSAQAVRPEYAVTIYCEPTDSIGNPIVQYVVRYQYLSFEVKDIKNDWQYLYSDKRTVNDKGTLSHDIDDYDILNSIQVPIHAYEQIVVQVSAILQYGQPFMTIQTAWTDSMFLTIPDNLLKEVSIDEMFKNAYEAKLYTNVQQAMEAAGVYRHINTNVTYAHRAQDIQYNNDDTVYTKIQQMVKDIAGLQSLAGTTSLNVFIEFNGNYYLASNGSQIMLEVPQTYYNAVFGSKSGAELEAALGTVSEHQFNICIVNPSTDTVYLHTMIPGQATDALSSSTWNNYADIAIIPGQNYDVNDNATVYRPTYAMALYRGANNALGNRKLVIDNRADYCYVDGNKNANINMACTDSAILNAVMPDYPASATDQQSAMLITQIQGDSVYGKARKVLADYPGIGLHASFPLAHWGGTDSQILTLPANDAAINTFGGQDPRAKAGQQLGMTFPTVKNYVANKAGSGILASEYVQASMFDIAGIDGKHYVPVAAFDPAIHKFTSGRASRGAFIFLNPSSIASIQLPPYGTSNATQVEPGEKETTACVIPCKFQCRMSDRLGITDASPMVMKESGYLKPSDSGGNFSYSKTINVNVKTGLNIVSFDVTMTMSYL